MNKLDPSKRIDLSGPAFFLVLGLAAFALSLGVPRLLRIYQVRAWTSVPATVTTSALKEAGHSKSGSPFYLVELEYRYDFGGKTRLGRRFYPDQVLYQDRFIQLDGQEEYLVAKHPAGTQITVLVDPENPESTAVEAPVDVFTLFLLGFGGGFVLLALLGLYLKKVLKKWANERRQALLREVEPGSEPGARHRPGNG